MCNAIAKSQDGKQRGSTANETCATARCANCKKPTRNSLDVLRHDTLLVRTHTVCSLPGPYLCTCTWPCAPPSEARAGRCFVLGVGAGAWACPTATARSPRPRVRKLVAPRCTELAHTRSEPLVRSGAPCGSLLARPHSRNQDDNVPPSSSAHALAVQHISRLESRL